MLLRVVESFLQLCQVRDKEVFPGVCQQIWKWGLIGGRDDRTYTMTEFSLGQAKSKASLAVTHSPFNCIIAAWSPGKDGCLTSCFFSLLWVTNNDADTGHDLVSFWVRGTKSVIAIIHTFPHSISFMSVPESSLHRWMHLFDVGRTHQKELVKCSCSPNPQSNPEYSHLYFYLQPLNYVWWREMCLFWSN